MSSLQTSKWCTSEFDSHATTNNKYNNMSRPMKMTPFLIKLIKEKSNVKNKR